MKRKNIICLEGGGRKAANIENTKKKRVLDCAERSARLPSYKKEPRVSSSRKNSGFADCTNKICAAECVKICHDVGTDSVERSARTL